MRNMMIGGVAAVALAFGATGTAQAQDNTLTGALLGGAAGAGLGYAFGKGKGAAIGGVSGLALGALMGSQINRNRQQQTYAPPPPAYYPPPPAYGYYQPQQGYAYQPAPPPPAYQPQPGYPPQQAYSTANCREYSGTIVIDGQEQRAFGRACLQPDGSWKIVQ